MGAWEHPRSVEHHGDGAVRRTSVPMWPKFRNEKKREHTLAQEKDDSTIVTVEGETYAVPTYEAFVTVATEHRLDVQTGSLSAWRWLSLAIADERATVSVIRNAADAYAPRVVSIEWRVGRDHARLFDEEAWGKGVGIDTIETANELLGEVGYSSPSALGQQTMRDKTVGRYTTASQAENTDFAAALIGGRAELVKPIRIGECVEIDRRMAYVDECRKEIPVGGSSAWYGPDLPPNFYRWYVACCVVYVGKRLPVGPFPLREGSGRLRYPTQVGTYEDVWLTTGEVEDTLAAGCKVVVRHAWCWVKTAPVLRDWAWWIYRKREQAKDPVVAACIKKVAVAGIGWFAMTGGLGRLTNEDKEGREAIIFTTETGKAQAFVEPIHDSYPTQMLAWALFIWSEARRTLYAETLRQKLDGNWLGYSNFDNLLLRRHSRFATGGGLGEWRESVIHNVYVDASRSLVCDEKDTRPGIPRATRLDPREPTFGSLHALAMYLGGLQLDIHRVDREEGGSYYYADGDNPIPSGEGVTRADDTS